MPTGRNDPCPCGSGKKYKKCCLAKDEAARADAAGKESLMGPPDSTENKLRYRIRDFSVAWDSRGENLRQAFKEWEGEEKAGQEYDQKSFAGLMDYFIHDYTAPGGNKPIIELFHEREALNIPKEERAILEDWLDNRRSFYEVQSVRPEEGGDLKDLFTGCEFQVYDKSLSRKMLKWDVVWLRLLPQGGRWFVTGTGIPVRRALKEALKDRMESMFHDYQTAYPRASWERFLKRASGQINQMITKLHEENKPEFLTGTGELMTPTEAVFEIMDIGQVRQRVDKMKDFMNVGESDEEPKGLRYDWVRRGPSVRHFPEHHHRRGFSFSSTIIPSARRRKQVLVLGNLTVTPKEIYLSCLSQERVDHLIKLLEKRLSGLVRFKTMKRRPMKDLLTKSEKDRKPSPSSEIPKDIQDATIRSYLEDHYKRWVDMTIPALDGLTPRQAARDSRKRPVLLELLKDFENQEEAQRRKGKPVYGIHRIKKSLGLEF